MLVDTGHKLWPTETPNKCRYGYGEKAGRGVGFMSGVGMKESKVEKNKVEKNKVE